MLVLLEVDVAGLLIRVSVPLASGMRVGGNFYLRKSKGGNRLISNGIKPNY